MQWAPKALYPQPRAYAQQKLSYLDLMKIIIDKGADVNARLKMKVWYSGYNFDLSGVDEIGASPFWRAAYAADIEAMKLLKAHGADVNVPTMRPAGRPQTGDSDRTNIADVSGLPPVPVGGQGVTPLQAASGVGYAEGFAANSHRYAPAGMLPAVKYLIEELGADVNARDHEGNTALHHAASRGDVEMILYLVSKGADVKAVNREGQTTADMANGPVQRTQPYPEALALLVKLGLEEQQQVRLLLGLVGQVGQVGLVSRVGIEGRFAEGTARSARAAFRAERPSASRRSARSAAFEESNETSCLYDGWCVRARPCAACRRRRPPRRKPSQQRRNRRSGACSTGAEARRRTCAGQAGGALRRSSPPKSRRRWSSRYCATCHNDRASRAACRSPRSMPRRPSSMRRQSSA